VLPYRHDKADELRSASALGAVDAMREVTKMLGKCWCYRLTPTWRIIPVSKWLVTPLYKPFRPFGRGTTLLRGLSNHGY